MGASSSAANCRCAFEEGTFYLLYGKRRLPIAPGTYRYVLDVALQNLAEHKDENFYAELQSILTALEYLPKRTETDPNASPSAFEKRKSSSDVSNAVARKRRKCSTQ